MCRRRQLSLQIRVLSFKPFSQAKAQPTSLTLAMVMSRASQDSDVKTETFGAFTSRTKGYAIDVQN